MYYSQNVSDVFENNFDFKNVILVKGAYNLDNIYETEYYLTIINIIYILGFIDAKRCYFLTKTYKDIKYDWYNSKIIFQYKSMISSVNCEDGNICCRTTGRTCCSDPSVSKDEDIFLYVILIYTSHSYLQIIV